MIQRDPAVECLNRAVSLIGTATAFARALGVSTQAVSNWRREGGIPPSQVPQVSRLTGMPPEELRPDLFAKPTRPSGPGFAEVQRSLVPEARAFGLDPDAIAAAALQKAIGDEKARRWAAVNAEAIATHTRYIEQNDTPLAKYRMF